MGATASVCHIYKRFYPIIYIKKKKKRVSLGLDIYSEKSLNILKMYFFNISNFRYISLPSFQPLGDSSYRS